MKSLFAFFCLFLFMVLPSIAQIQQGEASYYKDAFEGRKTASGELFQQALPTAAHRTLPLGTIVKVTNKSNGKSAKVHINDRGPFIRNRIIDVSKSVAERLGFVQKGTAIVDIEILEFGDKKRIYSEHELYSFLDEDIIKQQNEAVDNVDTTITETEVIEIVEVIEENINKVEIAAIEVAKEKILPKKETNVNNVVEEKTAQVDDAVLNIVQKVVSVENIDKVSPKKEIKVIKVVEEKTAQVDDAVLNIVQKVAAVEYNDKVSPKKETKVIKVVEEKTTQVDDAVLNIVQKVAAVEDVKIARETKSQPKARIDLSNSSEVNNTSNQKTKEKVKNELRTVGLQQKLTLQVKKFREKEQFFNLKAERINPNFLAIQVASLSDVQSILKLGNILEEFYKEEISLRYKLLNDKALYSLAVGKAQTREEAEQLLEKIKERYPYAFILNLKN